MSTTVLETKKNKNPPKKYLKKEKIYLLYCQDAVHMYSTTHQEVLISKLKVHKVDELEIL